MSILNALKRKGPPSTPILCPSCGQAALTLVDGFLVCTGRACGYRVPRVGKTHDLDVEAGDTQLDVEEYAAVNFADEQTYRNLFHDLHEMVTRIMGPGEIGETLEIGAGSGAWTWGLARSDRFHNVYATDISHAFLEKLADHCDTPGTLILRTPGESLNFRPGSLDLVLGRSVLHHIYDYKMLLARLKGWLKPGGVAMFFEPCLQGKLWVAYHFELIRRLDEQTRQHNETLPPELRRPTLSQPARQRLEGGTRHILKDFYHPGIDQIRPEIEDKYIFDIDQLQADGKAAGFAEAGFVSLPQIDGLARNRLLHNLGMILKDDKAILSQYEPLFDAFSATFGVSETTPPVAPMGYFWFRA